MRQRNASLAAKPEAAKPADDAQPKSLESDPKAMALVDQLKQMGYSGQDVAQAMDGGDQGQGGMEATKAAPMAIPGTM